MPTRSPASPPIEQLQDRLPLSWKFALAGEITVTYARARWHLIRRGLPAALEILRTSPLKARGADELRPDERVLAIRLGRIVGRTLRVLPFDSRCLMRSLVLTSLLARRGIASTLVIGVRSEPAFAAHAWVESFGTALLRPSKSRFQRLVEL